MRKKLRVNREAIRNLTAAERSAALGGQNVETDTLCSLRDKASCWPDPPTRAK